MGHSRLARGGDGRAYWTGCVSTLDITLQVYDIPAAKINEKFSGPHCTFFLASRQFLFSNTMALTGEDFRRLPATEDEARLLWRSSELHACLFEGTLQINQRLNPPGRNPVGSF